MNAIISLIKTAWVAFCAWNIVCFIFVGMPAAMAGGYPAELQTGFTGLGWSYITWLGQCMHSLIGAIC
jgi:hypothetical protein